VRFRTGAKPNSVLARYQALVELLGEHLRRGLDGLNLTAFELNRPLTAHTAWGTNNERF